MVPVLIVAEGIFNCRWTVFSNKTLEALARYQPVNDEEALHVPGIGAAKIQRYAEPFLEAIRVWKQSRRR